MLTRCLLCCWEEGGKAFVASGVDSGVGSGVGIGSDVGVERGDVGDNGAGVDRGAGVAVGSGFGKLVTLFAKVQKVVGPFKNRNSVGLSGVDPFVNTTISWSSCVRSLTCPFSINLAMP